MENKMYIVRFRGMDRRVDSEYYYNNLTDALKHAELFDDDESGLYRNVAVLEETAKTTKVLRIKCFFGGGNIFDDGMIVSISPAWLSPAEQAQPRHKYVILNMHEEMETATIGDLDTKISLGSSERVGLEMIYPRFDAMLELARNKNK